MLLDVHTSPVMKVGEWAADSRRYSKVESSHGKEIPCTKSATLTVRHERSIDIIHFMTRQPLQ